MSTIYWDLNQIRAAQLNPSQREVIEDTMRNTGGPVEVLPDRTVRAYQPQQMTTVPPRGLTRPDEEVIEGEVVEISNPQSYTPSSSLRGHAIPADVVLEARDELRASQAAWQKRAVFRLLNARRKKGRNLTAAEIHEITRRTR